MRERAKQLGVKMCDKYLVGLAVMNGHVECVEWLRDNVSIEDWQNGVIFGLVLYNNYVA